MDSKVQRLTLEDIYVSLRVALDAADEESADGVADTADMATLLAQSAHIAITGGPGCGKTTYLKVIATALADAHLHGDRASVVRYLGLNDPLPVPIFVTLGDYNRFRRGAADGSIRAYLNQTLPQKVHGVPADFFNRLLDGPTPVIALLDGLDEVADDNERALVSHQVATLINGSRVEHAVVSSRTRAYRGLVRLPDLRIAEVQPISPEQVAQLAQRWCTGVYPTPDQQREQAAALVAAIRQLEARRAARNEQQALVDTPLMVTVVAIVHYKNVRLPDQRAALYAKCVTILLEEKHHMPGEGGDMLPEWGGSSDVKRQLLAFLAYQMMTAGKKAGRSVDQHELESWLLPECAREYGQDNARAALRDFVVALRSRGSLIKEVDGRYSFVHLTFQEFLAAYYLAETVRNEDAILDALLEQERVTQGWWRETILLLIGHIGVSRKPAATVIVRRLAAMPGSDERQLSAAELATTGFVELESRDEELRTQLHERLIELATPPGRSLQPATRQLAGNALAALGDERFGVRTTIEHNGIRIPRIAWGGEVPAGDYTIGNARPQHSDEKLRPAPIRQPYRLARYPVTYAQFQCFLDADDKAEGRWWEGMPP